MGNDISHIISEHHSKKLAPLMRHFWEQQKLVFSGKKIRRYHPMVTRFSLFLASKSASSYGELRDSQILTLPGKRTLCSYKNVISATPGFNHEVIEELKNTTKDLKGFGCYVTISFEEMKIHSDLCLTYTLANLLPMLT